jgi:hypothetical protein
MPAAPDVRRLHQPVAVEADVLGQVVGNAMKTVSAVDLGQFGHRLVKQRRAGAWL